MPRKETATGGQISAQAQQDLVSDGIENFELPKSLVAKIAKSAIPENSKLQKETVLSLVKGSTVFINYLAATAHDVAVSKQHKSISASDVLRALEMIEFGDLVDKLQHELHAYRELAKTDRTKRGSANISNGGTTSAALPSKPRTGPVPGTITISAPAGKSKVISGDPLPPPFTTTPLVHPHGPGVPEGDFGESVSMGSRMAMDVDWDEELGEREGQREGEVEGEEGEDGGPGEDDEDEGDEEDEDEDEPEGEGEAGRHDDPMEIEAEELKGEVHGLETHEDPHSE